MTSAFKICVRRQEVDPGFLGLFTNPFYFARKGLMDNIRRVSSQIGGRILDIGCGSKPYRSLFTHTEYVGVDIDNPGHDHAHEDIDVFYDGQTLPFEDNSFDSAITNQVFEHVFNPDRFLSEINRVLKPGGRLLLTVPFVWDEHEQPRDYARYSSFGIAHVLEANGFAVESLCKSVNDFRVIVQLLILFIYKKVMTGNRWVDRALILFLMAPLNVLGAVVARILPSNTDLYLDNVVLARKIK